MDELNKEEEKAIRAFKRLAKIWPKTLWVYAADSRLQVMRKNSSGDHAMTNPQYGGVNPDFKVCQIEIEADGGDW